jgi:hypothetical protein
VEAPLGRSAKEYCSEGQKASAQERTSIRSKDSRASKRSAYNHAPIDTNAHVKLDQAHNCGDHGEIINNHVPTEADTYVKSDQAGTCDNHNENINNHVHIEIDTYVKLDQVGNCDSHDDNINNGAVLATSTLAPLQNTHREGPMSHEACRTLELLLGGKKRKGARRVLDSVLSNTRLKTSPDPVVTRRNVLLELGAAMTSLANGELHENPGIDGRVWKAVQNDLAFNDIP